VTGASEASSPPLAAAPRRTAVGQGLASHDLEAADVETASEGYAARFAGPTGAWLLEVQARGALELIRAARGAVPLRVLDVGGGHAQLTGALLAASYRVVVHGSAQSCHARLRTQGADVLHVTSRLWDLPFPDGSFDLAVAIRLLAHVERWRELLGELARVSRGLVLVDFPARSALHRLAPALFTAKRRLERNTRPYFDYTRSEVEGRFAELGLHAHGLQREFGLPMVLHRTLRRPRVSRALEAAAAASGWTAAYGSPVLMLAQRAPLARRTGGEE
jgi:SAM-dependent methyltransferase